MVRRMAMQITQKVMDIEIIIIDGSRLSDFRTFSAANNLNRYDSVVMGDVVLIELAIGEGMQEDSYPDWPLWLTYLLQG